MPLPVVAYYVLAALGGYLAHKGELVQWLAGSTDDWADSAAFNSRMRKIHEGILQLNDLFAKCKVLNTPEQAPNLKSWKSNVKLWSLFYKEVGTKYFDPSDEIIQEAKTYSENLARWIDTYQSLCGDVPTGMVPPKTEPSEKPTSWTSVLLWLGGLGAAAYVTSNYFARKKD